MKKSWKAALLSALVVPGAGQLWLKRYLRGLLLVAATALFSVMILVKEAKEAYNILNRIESEGGSIDLAAIAQSALGSAAKTPDTATAVAAAGLMLCWVIGVADAFVLGGKEERAGKVKPAVQPHHKED